MKRVDQTKFGKEEGDCFAACVASLLELPLVAVPNFCASEQWPQNAHEWMRERGLAYVGVSLKKEDDPCAWLEQTGGYSIVAGGSPRMDCLHGVIYYGAELVHDPHPSRDGVEYITHAEYLVPFDIMEWQPKHRHIP